jgi:hypothetical protein
VGERREAEEEGINFNAFEHLLDFRERFPTMLLCRSLRFLWDNVAEGNQLHSFNLAQGVHVSLSNPTATDETNPHHFTRHRSSPPQANFLL